MLFTLFSPEEQGEWFILSEDSNCNEKSAANESQIPRDLIKADSALGLIKLMNRYYPQP
jgi:hypothetical protein